MNWISVKDRLPEVRNDEQTSVDVLCCGKSTSRFAPDELITTIGWVDKNKKWHFVAEKAGNTFEYITHWTPLPEPPKE